MIHPYFETNTLRLVVFYTAWAIWAVPEFFSSFSQHARDGSVRKDRGSYLVLIFSLYLGMVLAFLLAFRAPAADIRLDQSVFFSLGIALMLAGVALRWYAIRTLGRLFTREVAIQAGHEIIQVGPYRLLRHPAYTGSLITLLGVGLALTNWAGLVILLVLTMAGFLYRISIEERALIAAFGDPYREYMHHTRRLIPFIW